MRPQTEQNGLRALPRLPPLKYPPKKRSAHVRANGKLGVPDLDQ